MPNRSLVRTCGALGAACSLWNLFGDIYYMDFFAARMSDLGAVLPSSNPDGGYLFRFGDGESVLAGTLAQAGSWMYPLWAFATVVPICLGLERRHQKGGGEHETLRDRIAPCALLAYGYCVVGGGLHGAFAFWTVLPSAYHQNQTADMGLSAEDDEQLRRFVDTSQGKILHHIAVGCIPGLVAFNVASIWIACLVHSGRTRFPRWFNLFNPMVTVIWVQIVGRMLLPDEIGFYFVGCLGTWGTLLLNLGTTYYLWNDDCVLAPSFPQGITKKGC